MTRVYRDLSYGTVHQTRIGYAVDSVFGSARDQFSYGDFGGYIGGCFTLLISPILIPIEFRRSFDRNFTQKLD